MPTLGLSMIVKNGAPTLRRCLQSARGLVDTMVIGDTGSMDETVAIARSFGATVLTIDWQNDFAAARNTVVAALDTDWVLTLDADEELPAEAHAWIRQAICEPQQAYLVQVRNYLSPHLPPPTDQVMLQPGEHHPQAPDAVAYFPSACCRLFRRRPGLLYTGRVHEMVDYNLPALGQGVEPAGFVIHHFGWYLADEARTAAKRLLYRELLAQKLADMPDDVNTLVRYATLLAEDCGQLDEALVHAERAAALDGSAAGAWLFTGLILRRLGRNQEALVALAKAPAGDQPAFRMQLEADALFCLERLVEARERYAAAHRLAPLDRIVSAKLALLEARCGAVDAGLMRLEAAVAAVPALPEVEELLILTLMSVDRPRQACLRAEQLAAQHGSEEAWLRMARAFARLADWPRALGVAEQGLQALPRSEPLHQFRIQAGVAAGRLERAAASAEQVASLMPTPKAYLRLAAVLEHGGDSAAAGQALERGLQLFPGDPLLMGNGNAPESGMPVLG